MPPSVILAVAILTAFIGLNVWSGAQAGRFPFAAIAVQALIVAGLVMRNRLAWQWGRVVPLFFVALTTVILGTARGRVPGAFFLVPAVLLVAALAVAIALGRPAARAWFGLVCGTCGNQAARPADFLFRKARCRTCGNVW